MCAASNGSGKKKAKKERVAFRRNRAKPARQTDWTRQAQDADGFDVDTVRSESVSARGNLSRRRTVSVPGEAGSRNTLRSGRVIAMRGLYAHVQDGEATWACTVRRVLRTRLIKERHPVTVGDRVRFHVAAADEGVAREGVIEDVEPRHGELRRLAGRRIHTMVANVDQAIIVTSAAEPMPKPHLVDRYIVAAHAGNIIPLICLNKMDLDDGRGRRLLERYAALGYQTLATSAVSGAGIDALRTALKGNASVVAGQSGVGKSSLLNAVQPGLQLRVREVTRQSEKGRHTTTTAVLLELEIGGFVVDTPGVRSFDLSVVPRNEYEAYFIEFAQRVAGCRFPDCTHTHESDCAIKQAVEGGEIHPDRYGSYVHMFHDPGAAV